MTELDPVLEKLIAQMLYEVHKVALIVAGQSDETTEAILDDLREGLEDLIPAETVERFCEAVVRCKAEMENGDIVGISRH